MSSPVPKDQSRDTAQAGDYPSWLYRYASTASQGVQGLQAVSDKDIESFHERGYLVIEEAFSLEETKAGLQGLVDLVDGRNSEFKNIQFENSVLNKLDSLSSEQRQDAVRKLYGFVDYHESLYKLAFHPDLLEMIGRIVGEKELNMFQDMALLKPPFIGREKPWHQDMAYFNVPLDTVIVGVWLALDEVGPENGCMMIIPGSHKQGAVIHFKKRDWQICDTDVYNDGAVAVPLKPGSILLFHGLIHHGTPANLSAKRRRAVQFHYRGASVEVGSEEDRLAVFGSEGKDVFC